MKLKKKKNNYYNLLNYNLINLKVYCGTNKLFLNYLNYKYLQGFKNKICIFELIQTKIFLKISLKIIYQFHFNNNKILFVGFPETEQNKFANLFKKAEHYFITINNFTDHVLSNIHLTLKKQQQNLFFNNEKQPLNKYFNLSIIPDLIVLFDKSEIFNYMKNIQYLNIPIILFFNSSIKSKDFFYKIPGNFYNKNFLNFCYFLLKSILISKKQCIS